MFFFRNEDLDHEEGDDEELSFLVKNMSLQER